MAKWNCQGFQWIVLIWKEIHKVLIYVHIMFFIYNEVTEYIWISHRYLILSQTQINWGSPSSVCPSFSIHRSDAQARIPGVSLDPCFSLAYHLSSDRKHQWFSLLSITVSWGKYLLKEQDRPHSACSSDLTPVEGPVCVRAEGVWSKRSGEASAVIQIWPCLSWPSGSPGARRIPFWAEVPRSWSSLCCQWLGRAWPGLERSVN